MDFIWARKLIGPGASVTAWVLPSCPAWLQDPTAMRVMIFMDWCHGKWERKRNLEGT